MDPEVAQLLALVSAHKWLAVAAFVIGLLVRLMKEDVGWLPVNVPARWRPMVALALGMISAVIQKTAEGVEWPAAIVGGFISSVIAMGGHAVIVDALRNGHDIFAKKSAAPPGAAVMMLCLALALPGCAAVVSALPTIVTYVTAGLAVLDEIQHFADLFFKKHPDADREREVAVAIGKCRTALVAAQRGTVGAEKLSQEQVDAAFNDFKVAYVSLMALVGPLGVHQGTDDAMRASPTGVLVVPPAEKLVPRVPR